MGELVKRITDKPDGAIMGSTTRILTSYDMETTQGKVGTQRAMCGQDGRIEDLDPRKSLIEHVVCHRITLEGPEGGEQIEAVRVVLVDTAGQRYSGVSEGVLSAILQISALIGPPPWQGGIKLRCVTGRSRRGFVFHTLELEG